MSLLTRREMVHNLGAGTGMIGLTSLLSDSGFLQGAPTGGNPLNPKEPHFKPKAKYLIHLFMNGGPSQVDTFDPKPSLIKYNGQRPDIANKSTERKTGGLMQSPFKFSKHGKSGVEVSEIFPGIASCIDDICVIRSMHTNIPNHEPSLLMMTSGETQPTRPSMGSWLLYGLGTENKNLPGFVVMCPGKPVVGPQLWSSSFLPGVYQGTHINNSTMDPKKIIQNVSNSSLGKTSQREMMDYLSKINQMHLEKRGGVDNQLETRIQSLEMAFRMQFEAQEVFDLNHEPKNIREGYGSSPFAQACLTARRLVERGVRVVQIFTGGGQPWDNHDDIAQHRQLAQQTDQPIAMLLKDLKSKGMLDETLVLWGGEFGRTPTSEGSKGRDHNNHGFTVWLAGGGVKGGYVHGASDEFGFAAEEKKMHVHDLHATMLHLMGINHEKLTYRYSGRDFRLTDVEGTVHKDIIA
jgi:hypothetical protein